MTVSKVGRAVRLGVAVTGLAGAFAIVAPVSASQAPVEVAAVQVTCMDLGYDTSACTGAVSSALVGETVGAVNAALADAGIDYVVQ
ncbi:MAG: hypothetical protein IT337_02205 [Thermomicrobiales bacterium]|nr:hypothetical protein [Thermomicrobiales bacterium]